MYHSILSELRSNYQRSQRIVSEFAELLRDLKPSPESIVRARVVWAAGRAGVVAAGVSDRVCTRGARSVVGRRTRNLLRLQRQVDAEGVRGG